jgi:hypothetical protein
MALLLHRYDHPSLLHFSFLLLFCHTLFALRFFPQCVLECVASGVRRVPILGILSPLRQIPWIRGSSCLTSHVIIAGSTTKNMVPLLDKRRKYCNKFHI